MSLSRCLTAALLAAGVALSAAAADTPLLIQTQPDGHYTLWHTEGATHISEDEVLELEAGAVPEGGPPTPIEAGKQEPTQKKPAP